MNDAKNNASDDEMFERYLGKKLSEFKNRKIYKELNREIIKFIPDDDRFYCTEMVDHCFRTTGHPLAERIRIKDFPNNGLVMYIGCAVGRIDMNNQAVVVGNERIGLFSSPMLETVLDLRAAPGSSPPDSKPVLASYRPLPPR